LSFFFQAEDGIRDRNVTGVQTCALPISSRYSDSLANLVGLDEYHKGKADKISGIEMPNGEDGRKVVLHFKEMKPGMLQSGNGYFLESAEPYHYLKDVPFDKLLSDDKVRKQPLFFGPYKVQKVV